MPAETLFFIGITFLSHCLTGGVSCPSLVHASSFIFFGMGSSECHEFERDFCSLIMSPRFTDAFYWPAFKVGACWH